MKAPLLLALLATACTAQPAHAESVIEKIGPNRFAVHSVAAAADAYTTYRCSNPRRCEEGNPAVRVITGRHVDAEDAVVAFVAMEALYVGGSLLIGEALGYDSLALDIFQLGSIGAHGVAASINLRF